MSEIKRVALSTFEPQKVSDKVNRKLCKTVRISVILPESNEHNCPEYNYKDQLAAVKKRSKQIKDSNNLENGLDPFGEEDDDVRRIALEMEAKYGTGVTGGKKKRKGRKDDYADIGMGYDESDSFIDNTDGYDEIIPQNVTTLHGGFYINCGALEFKTDEEASSDFSSSSSESEDESRPMNRKRILESSEESESDSNYHQEKVKKRRLIDPLKKTVKELLREKREDLNMSVPSELKPEDQEDNVEKDSLKENKKPMSITSVTDAIESVLKQVSGNVNYDNNQNKQNNDVNKKAEHLSTSRTDAPSSLEGESSQEANKIEKLEVVKLPENLPVDILDVINKIKQAALEYKGEGKKKFFTDEVNLMLLNLERKCKILGKSSRVKIYEHLASFVKIGKQTLVRRAKHLVLEDEEKKLKRLTERLKDNINQIMPSLTMKYEEESKKILQKKFSKESVDNEENKALKMPRRRFQWTDETRKLVKDILSIKKRCLLLEGKQKDKLEDQITQYLRTAILPLWPENWMYLNTLKKVYNNMTENSKLSDNSNSKSDVPKQHSNVTITPISNSKTTSKTDIIPNDVIFSKISNVEVKSSPKLAETYTSSQSSNIKIPSSITPTMSQISSITQTINNIRESEKSNDNYKKLNTIQSSSTLRDSEKMKHEKDHNYKSPNMTQSNNNVRECEKRDHDYKKHHKVITDSTGNIRESEKAKHERDQDYKKDYKLMMESSGNIREGEKRKYERDQDYKKEHKVMVESSSNIKESEKTKHERDHDYKKQHKVVMEPSGNIKEDEKSKHERDHDYKKQHKVLMEPSGNIREGEKSKDERDQDYKKDHKTMIEPSTNIREGEKMKYERDHDYKKPHKVMMEHGGNIREGEKSKHERDHDYKKSNMMQFSSTREGEKVKHERDHDYKKPSAMHSSGSHRESEKTRHERDHGYKKINVMQSSSNFRESEKAKHDKDRDHKKIGIIQSSSSAREGEKMKHDREQDYKKSSMLHSCSNVRSDNTRHDREQDYKKSSSVQPSTNVREGEKLKRENDHNYKKSIEISCPTSNRDAEPATTVNDSSVIVVNTQIDELSEINKELNTVIPKAKHCQVIDLTEMSELKRKPMSEEKRAFKFIEEIESEIIKCTSPKDVYSEVKKLTSKHPELNVAPSFLPSNSNQKVASKSDGDDIHMVMENLKALQKLSSPIKADNSTGSPVSVIAYNRSFSPKSNSSQSSAGQRTDFNSKPDFSGSFQDEFQKQFINSLQQMAASSSSSKSSYNRCS